MKSNYVYAVIALGLMLAYLAPIVVKLKEFSLAMVILSGLIMMGVDMWQSLHDQEA